MENLQMEVKGNALHMTVDLSKELGMSKSGKSQIIATTSGNAKIPGTDVIIGLNVYRKV